MLHLSDIDTAPSTLAGYTPEAPIKIELRGETAWAPRATWGEVADALVARLGGVPSVVDMDCELAKKPAPAPVAVAPKAVSTFGGELVTDDAAKARIEGQHRALIAGGIAVKASEQLYATGTRMAGIGYATQAARKTEHDAQRPAADVANDFLRVIADERREDRDVSAGELAQSIHVNGKVTAFGLALTEQAIRGLLGRLESPALSYVLGLRDRVASTEDPELRQRDRVQLAEVLVHECRRAPSTALKLRTRATGDIYACVSPGYVPADAPLVMSKIVRDLPADARGSFAYEPVSTAWEFRTAVWTPTPVDEQAVGEAFEGYVSFRSRDNGTSRFTGGGGVSLLRCLNASTYTAKGADVSRVHRGRILIDIRSALRGATKAITTLCQAWGTARAEEVDVPSGMTLEQAIPGFWRHLLRDRSSELVGVLPGRSEVHVKGLTRDFFGERREPARLVASDFAQGWTRYIQGQPAPVRRDAESAIGSWLVRHGNIAYAAE